MIAKDLRSGVEQLGNAMIEQLADLFIAPGMKPKARMRKTA